MGGIAAGGVFGESALFAANRFWCPLTELARSLGAESGSVTELHLPRWFAHNLPAIPYLCSFSSCSCTAGPCFGIEH